MRTPGQFTHPLVVRAKLEIAAACHAHGKVPSHNVTTDIKDTAVAANDAQRAAASPEMKRLTDDGALFIGRIKSYVIDEKQIIPPPG